MAGAWSGRLYNTPPSLDSTEKVDLCRPVFLSIPLSDRDELLVGGYDYSGQML